MIILECKLVEFYSEIDEFSFFNRIEKIKCITSIKGISESIFLTIKSKKISDKCLRELLSLFHRYKIEMSQLSIFVNENNKPWFINEKAYWFKKVFAEYKTPPKF